MYKQVGQIHCIQYIILVWYPNVCSWYCLSRQTVPHALRVQVLECGLKSLKFGMCTCVSHCVRLEGFGIIHFVVYII